MIFFPQGIVILESYHLPNMYLLSFQSAGSFGCTSMVIRVVVVVGIHSHLEMWTWNIMVQVPNPGLGDQGRASIGRDGSLNSWVTKEKQVYRPVYFMYTREIPREKLVTQRSDLELQLMWGSSTKSKKWGEMTGQTKVVLGFQRWHSVGRLTNGR